VSATATPATPVAAAGPAAGGRRALFAWIALLLVLMAIGVAAFLY
jgi:hypothetical protein